MLREKNQMNPDREWSPKQLQNPGCMKKGKKKEIMATRMVT